MPAINLSRKSRNLKTLIKTIIYSRIGDFYVFIVMKQGKTLYVVTPCKPKVSYIWRKSFDRLSGLYIRIREAEITLCGGSLIRIYWDGEYYRIKELLDNHPYIVVLECGNQCIKGLDGGDG